MKLDIKNLTVCYKTGHHLLMALDRVRLTLEPGRITALVGESGSGKTTLGKALMGLLPDNAAMDGQIQLDDADISKLNEKEMNSLRWSRMAMVFQNGPSHFNPVLRLVDQVAEPLIQRHGLAPEPARDQADDTAVLYLGRIMEYLPAGDLFHPKHPYTLGLARSFPGMEAVRDLGGIRGDAFYRMVHTYPQDQSSPHVHVVEKGSVHEEGRHAPSEGCLFRPRCTQAKKECGRGDIPLIKSAHHRVRCLRGGIAAGVLKPDTGTRTFDGPDTAARVRQAGRIVEMGAASDIFNHPQHPYTALLIDSARNSVLKVPS